MERRRIHRPIDKRLNFAVTSTTAVALLVACSLFILYEIRSDRERLIGGSAMLADVIATSSAVALAFDDEQTARETLEGLAGADTVLAAAIYTADGKRFTQYLPESTGSFSFPARPSEGHAFVATRLDVFQPVAFADQELGSVYIAFDASGLAERVAWYAGIACLVMLVAAMWSAWVAKQLRRQIAEPLGALAEGTRAIAAGDLSANVVEDRDDEIGALAANFNEMTSSLRGVVSQTQQSIRSVSEVAFTLEERGSTLSRELQRQNAAIAEAADSVEQATASAGGLSDNADQLAVTARETSSSIVEMDASIGEIAQHMDHLNGAIDTTSSATSEVTTNIDQVVSGVGTLQQATADAIERLHDLALSVSAVTEDAAECRELSDSASRDASEGRAAVGETVSAMGAVLSSFEQLKRRVDRLAEKSQSIDEIVQVIKGVAEQTGLLALNASIIAAQAGEHGRAFSVVADQVSSLADRSHRSAREIAELILAVQGDTAAAVGAVEEGSSVVEHGVRRFREAGDVLNRIIDGTQHSSERVRQIADATSRQAGDLQRVEQAVHDVRGIVEGIDRSTHHQHESMGEITISVERIRELGIAVRQSTDEQRRGSRLITNASANLSSMAAEMAEALGAQSRSNETIESALRVFNGVSEETTRGIEAINQSVATLSERAKQLEDEVGSLGNAEAETGSREEP